MAIPCFHKEITVQVLTKEFGFSSKAAELAAAANAAVDEKQGNDADQTHLHAMRGYVGGGGPFSVFSIETEQDCREAVQKLLDDARDTVVDTLVSKHEGDDALESLGA